MAFSLCDRELLGPEAARTLSGAGTSARRGAVSAWRQRASIGGCTQSVASIPMHRRRFINVTLTRSEYAYYPTASPSAILLGKRSLTSTVRRVGPCLAIRFTFCAG